MTLTIYNKLEQGTPEWHDARRGIITASTVGRFITPKTIKVAANADTRAMTYQLVAERINGWTEDTYVSRDMEEGHYIEPIARGLYSEHYAPVEECGFMVRDDWGYQVGYSPDGLVGETGLIEIKRHVAKLHLQIILAGEVPAEHMAQIQCGLLVSGREWCDYISFSGGMPLWIKRVHPDPVWRAAILEAVEAFEGNAEEMISLYTRAVHGLPPTDRTDMYQEMVVI